MRRRAMSQGKKVDMTVPIESVEAAVLRDDWAAARRAMTVRLARMFDATDSAREVKALSMSLDPMIDKCQTDYEDRQEKPETPLDKIREMANNA
jgi:hypothetical protein